MAWKADITSRRRRTRSPARWRRWPIQDAARNWAAPRAHGPFATTVGKRTAAPSIGRFANCADTPPRADPPRHRFVSSELRRQRVEHVRACAGLAIAGTRDLDRPPKARASTARRREVTT